MVKANEELNFTEDYVLEDEYVKLIPLQESHCQPLSLISNDPEIWKYFFERGDDFDSLWIYFHTAMENRKLGREYPFVVYDKIKNEYAGTTRFYEYSPILNTIKLGHTWYGKAFRGTVLNKRCKYLLFQFAFEELGIERIGFGSYIDNVISIAAMKSVGCKKEGVLRNMFPSLDGQGRSDNLLMGLLKHEWHENVKAKLALKINQ
ncbi:GNAT family protein [Maribacter sp. TH_r10]|uniref:GNAT family N-acetyltransferase n=1 Tax=Maribacter sp. TH_r10 TaxID=3082086 RepID=UPI002952F2C7|nr:GNAT family protein [Maribacter sp. TH_r10]MDV7137757.1 GNAT family protein [Maribacter sp. TH_r10]